ncbi:C2H2 finger domain-containing protein [Cordyceps javanica]|uniref:C2H2 finger domain-containing protein n=1 Tax=Cordyceps javanica TaxID=43265 RepID=A0A545UKV3_9HYPO|nr:C2H2 finger domain-containing protein [Cordyceps javanica]
MATVPQVKRRKLAPKRPYPYPTPHHDEPSRPSHMVPDAPHHSQRHVFEAFARHLHDAAMLINRQGAQPSTSYTNVSVLSLGWQNDSAALENIRVLQQVFVTKYRYYTQTWQIPTLPGASLKLETRIASFLENAPPKHLLIIYYSGHGYRASDGQLYWACSPQDHSIRLAWDGVRCALQDAQSDILLLLDTCAAPDSIASTHGLKQVIAACSPEATRQPSSASRAYFSPCLTAALRQLSRTASFSAQQLCQEIKLASQANPNSTRFPSPAFEPQFFAMTPDRGRSIQLAPLTESSSDTATPETARPREGPPSPNPGPKLTFDEARILVCTTFVGDATPDMSAFHSWLQSASPLAMEITVEGLFSGPPTVLLISMPTSLWASVRHDKIWFYLGTITSRNMISLYDKMVGTSVTSTTNTETTATAASESTPASAQFRPTPAAQWLLPGYVVKDEQRKGETSPTARLYQSLAAGGLGIKPTLPGTDSVEMQEAAEQLKALSHVRHRSGDATANTSPQRAALPVTMPALHPGFRNLTCSESMPVLDSGTGSAGARMSRMLGKPAIRCAHCSHAPFKDSSSLRKHITTAHTRPFPCAFYFAGCTSRFGSKNEWKRHIASQHLCLQYYRCSICLQTTVDGKGNEFNRKDLFRSHLHRMHVPLEVKRALAKGDNGQQQTEWETYVREMQQTCLIQRRYPPQRSSCPKPGCARDFKGPAAWNEWTKHVGRHMEKGEGDNLGVDNLLVRYALDEGIIESVGDKRYKLGQILGGGAPSQPASQAMSETHEPLATRP